jgi:UDP-glucose 4-epimerase
MKIKDTKTILVTGGTGYIGSHTCVELLASGHKVVVVDNLSNSQQDIVGKIEKISNANIDFCHIDIRDKEKMEGVFAKYKFDSIIHFAGLKAVGKSVIEPLSYYENNVCGSLVLFDLAQKYNCNNIVFSSSATVYNEDNPLPWSEKRSKVAKPNNPYGETKLMVENILQAMQVANPKLNVAILRYFNPIGAHSSTLLGDNPNGEPNNLMPYITRVAKGQLECLSVFGGDYKTKDGTCVRDYLHVVDLAKAHSLACEKLDNKNTMVLNLGTGIGYSVLDIISAFEKTNKLKINYKIVERREGDLAEFYADASLAKEVLGWEAKCDLEKMCRDSWEFEKKLNNKK